MKKDVTSSQGFRERLGGGVLRGGGEGGFVTIIWIPKLLPVMYTGDKLAFHIPEMSLFLNSKQVDINEINWMLIK